MTFTADNNDIKSPKKCGVILMQCFQKIPKVVCDLKEKIFKRARELGGENKWVMLLKQA